MNAKLSYLGLGLLLGGALTGVLAPACGGNPELISSGGASSKSSSTGAGATNASGSTTSGMGGTSDVASSSSGTGGMAPCTGDADCAGQPGGNVCDTSTGHCVGCLPSNDKCGMGQWCDPMSLTCVVGCSDDTDCITPTVCDTQKHQCIGCLMDADCGAGTICDKQICVPGCTPMHDCPMGITCCTGSCVDTQNDIDNCNGCGLPCPQPPNTLDACNMGMCKSACKPPFVDCNGSLMDGCEHNTLVDGPCTCAPGAMQACYQGAPGTQNIGPCKGGTQTCDPSGTSWGPCLGQVLPSPEKCFNNVDEDCNGIVDDVQDTDGDGWTRCQGDCCETLADCPSPALVNPGAFEVVGDGVDNDCDPTTSDVAPPTGCSTVAKFAGVTAQDMAFAMDICQTTTANPPLPMKKWGLINSKLLLADGSVPNATALSDIQNKQTAVLINYGTGGIVPKNGATFAGMSSGYMRDEGDLPPNPFIDPDPGTALTTSIAIATAGGPLGFFVGKHGKALPSGSCNGMTCPTGTLADDSVNLELQIRVPTNAQSFSYDFRFFTAEYQIYQCTLFNDFYLALLTSGAPGIPTDHQISFDANKNPISVNNAFFQVCPGNGLNCGACPNGTAELAGTGMELFNDGGGTTWLTTDAPVLPGETITLDFQIFDTQDHILDSLAILDNFRWNLQPLAVGTHQ